MKDFFAPENLDKKLKLDLHCHVYECLGYYQPSPDVVRKVLDRIKEAGLDGIADTEHWDREYGYRFMEMAKAHFDDDILILPGREWARGVREEQVELYLPNNKVFRFWVHPRELVERSFHEVGEVQGIEVDNALHGYEIAKEKAREYAREKGLLMLTNSDAHALNRIGSRHNVVSLRELMDRAVDP
ncbi:MAG: PHP domain-containing protein [Chloroflexi bacterium]|nr:PHP domain-containing protein [Chloroflexota bacterium]